MIEATLSEFLRSKRSKNTREAYERDLRQFFEEVAPNKSIDQIDESDLMSFEELERNRDRSTATIYRKLAAVKSLLTYAHRKGLIDKNPGVSFQLVKVSHNRNEKILSVEDVQKIIDAAGDSLVDQVLLGLLYDAKLRVSEAIGLQWKHLTPRPDKDSGQVFVVGKGDKPRHVLLSDGLYKRLIAIRGESDKENWVFPSSRKLGSHITRVHAWKKVRDYTKIAGVPYEVSCHWLRHSGASHQLDGGAPISTIQSELGHSDLKTTSIYIHARPDIGGAEYSTIVYRSKSND